MTNFGSTASKLLQLIADAYDGLMDFDEPREHAWLDGAAANIAVLIGDAPARFLDHDIRTSDEGSIIVVVTDDPILITTIVDKSFPFHFQGVQVISRKHVESVEVVTSSNAVGAKGSRPQRISVKLALNERTLAIPLRS